MAFFPRKTYSVLAFPKAKATAFVSLEFRFDVTHYNVFHDTSGQKLE